MRTTLRTHPIRIFLLLILIFICPGLGSANYFEKFALSPQNKLVHSAPTSNDLWAQLRDGIDIPESWQKQPAVQKEIAWYMNHPKYLYVMSKQAAPYLYYVYQQTTLRKLPVTLAFLPFIESAYNPCAVSTQGAAGLWQIMSSTGSGFGVKQDWWYDGRHDVGASTGAMLDYLAYLNNFFNQDWLLAFAAYDAGDGTVKRAMKHNERLGKPTDFWSLHLPHETEYYVPKLVALAMIVKYPNRYPMKLYPIKAEPYLAQVNPGSQIDLTTAAKLAHISLSDLYHLNPGYKRWATDPNGTQSLFIPTANVDEFESNLAKLPRSKRVTWQHYRVKQGDVLGTIAHNFHTSSETISKVNHLKNDNLHIGQSLLIPQSKKIPKDMPRDLNVQCRAVHVPSKPGPRLIHYKVKHGDNLWSLSNRYHIKPAEIRFWNHLGYHQDIHKGQPLTLWVKQNPEHFIYPNYALSTFNHEVQSGDSLYSIAKRFSTTMDLLKKANNLSKDMIRVGHVIKVPKHYSSNLHLDLSPGVKGHEDYQLTYTVKKHDTLSQIADYYKVSTHELEAWNHITHNTIKPHEKLIIYTNKPPL